MTKTSLKPVLFRLIKYLIVIAGALFVFYRINTRQVVVDGDTLIIGREKIRFNNIDAPEMSQLCLCKGEQVKCGVKSKEALYKFIGSNKVSCEPSGRDFYGRLIAECFIQADGQKTSLNTLMIRSGMAIVISKHDEPLLLEEIKAIQQKVGFWACEGFEDPAAFRKTAPPIKSADPPAPEPEQPLLQSG
ncbi:MAG: thermonuclease family protein [Alphaproteobacteria bacterium]|nr:thermonuclease family protein [Alphaproteobacteria bacterium]